MDSGAVHAEAGVGVEASGYCDLRLVELKVPGDSTRLRFPWASGRVWNCVHVEGQ